MSGKEGSGGVPMAEGGPGWLLGTWVGVEEGPPTEAGVEGPGGTWACAEAWCCCSCCCCGGGGCRLAEALGGGVARKVGWAVGPQGSWELRDPSAFRGRLEFCGCWNKEGCTVSISNSHIASHTEMLIRPRSGEKQGGMKMLGTCK